MKEALILVALIGTAVCVPVSLASLLRPSTRLVDVAAAFGLAAMLAALGYRVLGYPLAGDQPTDAFAAVGCVVTLVSLVLQFLGRQDIWRRVRGLAVAVFTLAFVLHTVGLP